MKLQIDTEGKTIKVDKDIEPYKVIDNLEWLLPNGMWKEFALRTDTAIVPSNNPISNEPFVFEGWRGIPNHHLPWIGIGSSFRFVLIPGTYDVELIPD